MIVKGMTFCPDCGGKLKHYDRVKRTVKTRYGRKKKIYVQRYKCTKCGKIHREMPYEIWPYVQYETEIVVGVIDGLINEDTIGFEDRPCEMTFKRWRTRFLHSSL